MALKQFKRSVVYYTIRGIIAFFNNVPRKIGIGIGAWLGLGVWMLDKPDRYKIDRHLKLAFGDELTHAQRRRIGRNFFINSGRNMVDVVRFRRHYTRQIKPLVTVEGLEYFDQAYKAGNGLIGITGHLGNFELLAVHMASLGYQIAAIGRELYDPRLDALLVENRTAMGLTNLATTDSPKKYLSWLKDGKALGVLIDTDSHRVRSMMIPSFGRLANTPVGQTMIGLRAGSAFLPMACVRTPGNRYKIIVKPPLQCEISGDPETDTRNVTSLCSKALDDLIRQYPDQWIWMHRRWRTKPPDTP